MLNCKMGKDIWKNVDDAKYHGYKLPAGKKKAKKVSDSAGNVNTNTANTYTVTTNTTNTSKVDVSKVNPITVDTSKVKPS